MRLFAWITRLRTIAGALLFAALALPAAAALTEPRTLTFTPGVGAGSQEAHLLEQRPDGTATLVSGGSRQQGTWVDDGTTLTVTYGAPRSLGIAFGEYEGWQYQQDYFELGRLFRRVSGSIELGQAATVPLTYFVWAEGPLQGTVVTVSDADSPTQTVQARRPGLRLPLAAAEFPIGAQWAGIILESPGALATFEIPNQDILRILTERRAAGTVDTNRMPWRVRSDALVLTRTTPTGTVQLRYWRMGIDASSGAERWMLTVLDASGVAEAWECLVARVDPAFVFTPAGIVGDWFSSFSPPGGDEVRFRFFADRSADQRVIEPDGNVRPGSPINGWDIQRSGTRMQLLRPTTTIIWDRWWQPVRRSAEWMVALETLDYRRVSTGDQVAAVRRLIAFRLMGPAIR